MDKACSQGIEFPVVGYRRRRHGNHRRVTSNVAVKALFFLLLFIFFARCQTQPRFPCNLDRGGRAPSSPERNAALRRLPSASKKKRTKRFSVSPGTKTRNNRFHSLNNRAPRVRCVVRRDRRRTRGPKTVVDVVVPVHQCISSATVGGDGQVLRNRAPKTSCRQGVVVLTSFSAEEFCA